MKEIIEIARSIVNGALAIGCAVFLVAWGIITVGATKGERLFGEHKEQETEK